MGVGFTWRWPGLSLSYELWKLEDCSQFLCLNFLSSKMVRVVPTLSGFCECERLLIHVNCLNVGKYYCGDSMNRLSLDELSCCGLTSATTPKHIPQCTCCSSRLGLSPAQGGPTQPWKGGQGGVKFTRNKNRAEHCCLTLHGSRYLLTLGKNKG